MLTPAFMSKGYKQLTVGERDLIGALKAAGKSIGDIGREVGRDKSTISRELRRNGPPIHNRYYLSHRAHERSVEMRIRTHTRARLKSEEIMNARRLPAVAKIPSPRLGAISPLFLSILPR